LDRFIIEGGHRLEGRVAAAGSKNSVLPIMAACLLAEEPSVIHNVPRVVDVRTMMRVLENLGVRVELRGHTLHVDPSGLKGYEAPYELVKRMRASYYVLGPLLARQGRARVSLPGGCAIGARPVDLHLRGMVDLGAKVAIEHGYIVARARSLRGDEIHIEGVHGPSVGATINVMMAAALARGSTVIEGAACEPEVEDVAHFLNAMGVTIVGAGTTRIEMTGAKRLNGVEYRIIPDRIEVGTLAIGAAITGGSVRITRCRPQHLQAVIDVLRRAGVPVEGRGASLFVKGGGKRRPVDVKVAPYPGFPTDMQAQMTALMAVTPGISVVTETIFENRFMHLPELRRMGADITIEDSTAIVRGVEKLSGAPVMASDLRASAALILAGLVARGETSVSRVYHLDRGYEEFEVKLRSLGARIERVSE
jgi:UDP-N-acetylglucosamine 1-carboxyvinyltransferase